MYTYDTGLIRLRYTVTDTYRVVKSAGYTLNSSENEFKFMALQSWRVNSMNSYSTCRVLSPRAPGGRAHLETANKTHMENSAVCDRSHRRDAGATPVAGRSRYDSLTPLTLSLCKTIQLYRYRHRYLTCDWSGMTGGLKFGTRGACIWPQGVWPVQIKLPGELKFGT